MDRGLLVCLSLPVASDGAHSFMHSLWGLSVAFFLCNSYHELVQPVVETVITSVRPFCVYSRHAFPVVDFEQTSGVYNSFFFTIPFFKNIKCSLIVVLFWYSSCCVNQIYFQSFCLVQPHSYFHSPTSMTSKEKWDKRLNSKPLKSSPIWIIST